MTDVKYTFLDNDEILLITTKTQDVAIKFYIDTYCNRCNILGDDDCKHDWVITTNDIAKYTEIIDGYYYYKIPAEMLGLHKYSGLYIVSVAFSDAYWYTNIAYDMDNLYCFRYELMKNVCIPCDDITKYNKTINFMLSEIMFRNSVSIGRYDDALGFYETILKFSGNCSCCTGCWDCNCRSYSKPKQCKACT